MLSSQKHVENEYSANGDINFVTLVLSCLATENSTMLKVQVGTVGTDSMNTTEEILRYTLKMTGITRNGGSSSPKWLCLPSKLQIEQCSWLQRRWRRIHDGNRSDHFCMAYHQMSNWQIFVYGLLDLDTETDQSPMAFYRGDFIRYDDHLSMNIFIFLYFGNNYQVLEH